MNSFFLLKILLALVAFNDSSLTGKGAEIKRGRPAGKGHGPDSNPGRPHMRRDSVHGPPAVTIRLRCGPVH